MPDSITRSVRIPRDVYRELQQLTKRARGAFSINAVLIRAVRYGLPRLRPRRRVPKAPVIPPAPGGADAES